MSGLIKSHLTLLRGHVEASFGPNVPILPKDRHLETIFGPSNPKLLDLDRKLGSFQKELEDFKELCARLSQMVSFPWPPVPGSADVCPADRSAG